MEKRKGKRRRKQLPTIFGEEETENSSESDISNSFGNGVDQSNLLGQQDTNKEEKALANVELGGAKSSSETI